MNKVLSLFEELAGLADSVFNGRELKKFRPKSLPAKTLVSHYLLTRSLSEAFFKLCSDPECSLSNQFFGSIVPTYNYDTQELVGSDRGRSLYIALCPQKEPNKASCIHAPNTVILYFDFSIFLFFRADKNGRITKPFATFTAQEMCEEIVFTGSVWNSIFPTHYAIVSRTISYSFAQDIKGELFSLSTSNDLIEDERIALKQLDCLSGRLARLLSLEAFRIEAQSCSRPPKLLAEHREGSYVLRRYSPQRTSLFDFGEPAVEFSRGDIVATYKVGREEFHREFFVHHCNWKPYEEELLLAAFDLLHMLAIRRAKLFRTGFASRVYNVLFPPLLLASRDAPYPAGYALFPCLNLYRTLRHGFRRTLSMTYIVLPVEFTVSQGKTTGLGPRSAPLEELHQLKSDLLLPIADQATVKDMRQYGIGGSARSYYRILPSKSSIPELLQQVSRLVLLRVMATSDQPTQNLDHLVDDMLFTSNRESRIATMALLVEWNPPEGFTQPWERWISTGADRVFRNSLFRTLFYHDYLKPDSGDASRHAARLEEFNVGNTMGADMGGMTLFKPQEALKVVLYPRQREMYPDFSIVRWMAWQVYIDSALASLRALIYKFQPALEDRGYLYSIIEALDEMVQEFVDFYDLDIRDYDYRKEYEKLRALMHVDLDYEQLLSKFSAAKEDESLREQRLINKLIVSLTLATVTITVVSTIAQMGGLSKSAYLVIALTISTVMVTIGYIIFDPLRLGVEHVLNAISKMRRTPK